MTDKIRFPNLFDGELDIIRVAFTIFGIDIYWYGILITLGIIIAVIYALNRAKSFGLIPDRLFDVTFAGGIAGVIGARLYYVVFKSIESGVSYSLKDAVLGIRDGGLAIYGGIIFAMLAAVICAKIIKIRVLPILDLAGLGFLIGQSIGRWGNFFNQEAFGSITSSDYPLGMTGNIIQNSTFVIAAQNALPSGELALVHPCFLYESLWCALGFIVLHFYSKKRTFDGEIFLLYIGWYGLGRAFIESLRTDSLYAGEIKISQAVAVITSIAAIGLFIYFKVKLSKLSKIGNYKMACNDPVCIEKIENYPTQIKLEREKRLAVKAMRKAEKEQKENKAESILGNEDKLI